MLLRCLFLLLLSGWALPSAAGPAAPGPADTARLRAWCLRTEFLLLADNARAETESRAIIEAARRQGFGWGEAQGYWLLASALRSNSQFDSSLYYAQRALTLFAAQRRPDGRAAVYTLLAQNYKRMGDAQHVQLLTRTALRWATQACQVAQQAGSLRELSRARIVQGIIYRDLGRLDSAKACYLVSIALEQQHDFQPSSLPVAYADYGQALMDADKNFDLAIAYFRRALPLYRRQANRNGQEHAYRNLSWAYRQQHRHPQALAAADSALALGRAIGDPHRLSNSLQAAYLANRDAGRLGPALKLLEEQRKVEQGLVSADIARAVETVAARYKADQLQTQITRLDQDNARRTRQLGILAGVLLVLGALLGVTIWQYRLIRRAHAQLQATNATIQVNNRRITEQASRLTMLMQELHHRVKNNLAIVSGLLRLQANRLGDASAVQAVRESQQRVEAMSLIHQRLYQTDAVTTVNMQHYVTDLADSLRTAYGHQQDQFDLELAIQQPLLDVNLAVPLGLLLNELLTNAFKHAYAEVARPGLRIYLGPAPGGTGLLVEVQDNGPGLRPGQWLEPSRSFGKRLIASLSEQLGGEMEIAPDVPGTCFRLRLPREAVSRELVAAGAEA